MNSEMWNNKINQKNVSAFLKTNGVEFIGPEYGKLSCGESRFRKTNEYKINKNSILQICINLKFLKIKNV